MGHLEWAYLRDYGAEYWIIFAQKIGRIIGPCRHGT
jgi:hypothetical protein